MHTYETPQKGLDYSCTCLHIDIITIFCIPLTALAFALAVVGRKCTRLQGEQRQATEYNLLIL